MPLKDNFAEVPTRTGGGGQLSTGQQTSICQAAAWRRPCVKFTASMQKNSKIVESSTCCLMMLATSDELKLELDLRIEIDSLFPFKILMIITFLTVSSNEICNAL